MQTVPCKQSSWPLFALRFVLPATMALLFLQTPGYGASNPSPAVAHPPGPEETLRKPGMVWGPAGSPCPLPPGSAFSFQTNLRKYLETWPTPGSTSTEPWPEYVPEEGEEMD